MQRGKRSKSVPPSPRSPVVQSRGPSLLLGQLSNSAALSWNLLMANDRISVLNQMASIPAGGDVGAVSSPTNSAGTLPPVQTTTPTIPLWTLARQRREATRAHQACQANAYVASEQRLGAAGTRGLTT